MFKSRRKSLDHSLLNWLEPATVRVYDSMNLRLSSTLIKLVADLLHTSNSSIKIEYVQVQYQCGGSDCGLFALAFACSLCHQEDPAELKYDQNEMRSHLVHSLEAQTLSPFPCKCRYKAARALRGIQKIDVYCICRLPDDGRKMIKCSSCNEWFHTDCVRAPRLAIKDKKHIWKCKDCSVI